jgi:hypothetical protein
VNREVKARERKGRFANKARQEAGETTDAPDDEYHGSAEHLDEEQKRNVSDGR